MYKELEEKNGHERSGVATHTAEETVAVYSSPSPSTWVFSTLSPFRDKLFFKVGGRKVAVDFRHVMDFKLSGVEAAKAADS